MLNLQTELRQQLALTPQLQQAIQLLQLPALALETQIRTLLQENVMLESVEEAGVEQGDAEQVSDAQNSESGLDTNTSELSEAGDWRLDGHGRADQPDGLEPQGALAETLREHLLWQLEMSALAPEELAIGVALIDSLNEDGYLTVGLNAIRDALAPDLHVKLAQVERTLHYIQCFDPIGIAARDLTECLHLQLEQMPATATRALTKTLIDNHLEALASLSAERLAKRVGVSLEELQAALVLLRSLEPHPGRGIGASAADTVVPDVVVVRGSRGWQVQLNSAVLNSVRVNSVYAAMLKKSAGSSHEVLTSQLQEARWFVRSVAMRHETVLKVAHAIVAHQSAFLERGEESLNPLLLKEIAGQIEVHESTVSRVVANKFMQTPRGTFPFKAFFSQALNTNDSQCATRAIRARLRKLIVAESPRAPLSDGALAAALSSDGITIARRTVAKYRDEMGFATCQKRRRMASLGQTV